MPNNEKYISMTYNLDYVILKILKLLGSHAVFRLKILLVLSWLALNP